MKRVILVLVLFSLLCGCSDSESDSHNTTEPNPSGANIIINEVMPYNESYLKDEFNEYDPWIELMNKGDEPVDINSMYLSATPDLSDAVEISSSYPEITTIENGDLIILWIDDQPEQGVTHLTNFGITSQSRNIYLIDYDGITILDSIQLPDLSPNNSYGRLPDGSDDWQIFGDETGYAGYYPTPGEENGSIHIPSGVDIVINEVMSYNESFITDEFNEYDRWIELMNKGDYPVDVGGLYLSSTPDFSDAVEISSSYPEITTIENGGLIILWIDDQPEQGVTHLSNFGMSSQNRDIFLFDFDGVAILDSVQVPYLMPDTSYGRMPDGSDDWLIFGDGTGAVEYYPSPGTENGSDHSTIYAYSLDQFVPEDMLADMVAHDDDDIANWNELFYFWSLATDGFSPRHRGYDDMNWTDWEQGYYIPELDNRIKFPHLDSQGISSYNIKYMDTVYVYRGINAIVNDDLSILYELNHMPIEQVENYDGVMENAIKLSNFVPEQIAALDSVDFIAVDGYSQTYYPDEVADGYWLVDSEKTIFPNLDLPGMKKKFKWIKSMEFFGQYQEITDFQNENLGSQSEANWSFSFPEDLSSFTGIPWE